MLDYLMSLVNVSTTRGVVTMVPAPAGRTVALAGSDEPDGMGSDHFPHAVELHLFGGEEEEEEEEVERGDAVPGLVAGAAVAAEARAGSSDIENQDTEGMDLEEAKE